MEGFARKKKLRTICEVHRELYRLLMKKGVKGEALDLVDEAYDMGKRMGRKLTDYYIEKHPESKGKWYDEDGFYKGDS